MFGIDTFRVLPRDFFLNLFCREVTDETIFIPSDRRGGPPQWVLASGELVASYDEKLGRVVPESGFGLAEGGEGFFLTSEIRSIEQVERALKSLS